MRDVEAGLVLHPDQELAAVGGPPAGFGGDGAQPPDRAAGETRGAGMQRRERPVHRDRAEPARPMQALAEADDAAEAVEDAEAVARGGGHQHAAVVGAEVEGGEGGAGELPRIGGLQVGGVGRRVGVPRHHRGILIRGRRNGQASSRQVTRISCGHGLQAAKPSIL